MVTVGEAAGSVRDSLASRLPKPFRLTARPYNKFSLEEWYLVPTTEWPAYYLAKLYLGLAGTKLLCALYFEKGVEGAAVQAGLGSKDMDFSPRWAWDRIIPELLGGRITATLAAACIKAELEPILAVNCEPAGRTGQKSRTVFRVQEDRLELIETVGDDSCGRVFAPVNDLRSLVDRLNDREWREWLWVDVFAGAFAPWPDVPLGKVQLLLEPLTPYLTR